MRRLVIAISLVSVCVDRPAAAQDLSSLHARASRSVVSLRIHDRFGAEVGAGTGFVAPGGVIVTNHHVVEDASSIVATTGGGEDVVIVGLLADDEKADLAILETGAHAIEPIAIATAPALVGQHVVVVGNPLGFSGTLSEGIVSAVRADGVSPDGDAFYERPLLQITAPISPGSSGSPVMDTEGRLLGVAMGHFGGGQALNFAIPSASVVALLAEASHGRRLRSYGAAPRGVPRARNLAISAVVFAAVALVAWRVARR